MAEDEIDPVISRWIVEFLLHQPIEDRIIESLARALLISDKDFALTKLHLLHKLQYEVSNCPISEKVLIFLEEIHEVDQCLGSKDCAESLKKAYCAVCVEFTVGFLRRCGNDVKGGYFDVVKSLWKGRVREMERKEVGLVSRELLEWRDDIEEAVWEESVCLKVVERSKDVDAVELVKLYVKEEQKGMGPPYLELVWETLKKEEGAVSGAVGSRKRGMSDRFRRNDARGQEFDKGEMGIEDIAKKKSPERRKHVAHKRSRIGACRPSCGAKIADVEHDLNAGKSCNEQLRAVEVEKVQEDQNLDEPGVEDRANVGVQNMDFEPPEKENRATSSGVEDAVNMLSGEAKQNCPGPSSAPKSLMERTKTACTFEWDDSIDSSSAAPSDSSARPNRPSSKQRRVSPFNIYEQRPKGNLRRSRKTWSNVEEDTLRAGVKKFGLGYWKVILNSYHDIFQDRTEVDLKDKWRNMTR